MLNYEEIVLRLFLSALLGSIIGIERERLDWVAGLRTYMLVCVGATMFMLVSAFGFRDVLAGHSNVVLDPSRVAAQVVSGIGFLGAGTICLQISASIMAPRFPLVDFRLWAADCIAAASPRVMEWRIVSLSFGELSI